MPGVIGIGGKAAKAVSLHDLGDLLFLPRASLEIETSSGAEAGVKVFADGAVES
jgi:hypothetical protein